jgi:hypothetical protein
MERSMTRIGAQLVATTMIIVGAALARAGELPGIVLAVIGMLLALDLAGAFETRVAHVPVLLRRARCRGLVRRRLRRH